MRLKRHSTYEIADEDAATRSFPVLRHVLSSNEFNTLDSYYPAVILEMEDQSFHTDSAVPMPLIQTSENLTLPSGPDDLSGMADVRPQHPWVYDAFHSAEISFSIPDKFLAYRRGLVVLAVTYFFLEHNPGYRLLLAGHTDTSGSKSHNLELSDLRAESVECLLRGDRLRWIEIACEHHCVEDYQLILTYFSRTFGWPCDPGSVDGDCGPQTDEAVMMFQQTYNEFYKQAIAVDGEMGPQTWGAVFDVYLSDLASLLDVKVSEVERFRQHLRYVAPDHHWIGCGEQIPIDEPERKNYRSKENRRVEFLFFHENDLPDLQEHISGGSIRSGNSGWEASGVYAPGAYKYLLLNPLWWFGLPYFKGSEGVLKIRFFDPAQDPDVPSLHEENPLLVAEPDAEDLPYASVPLEELT